MYYKYKKVKNPVQSTFNDVKLFEQNSYCYNYLKKRFPDKTAEELKEHSEISSSCFRQASEYYNAASSVSISTSPLLYSYALNNLLKGVCYLITFDEKNETNKYLNNETNSCETSDERILEYNGQNPDSGNIFINKNGDISMAIYNKDTSVCAKKNPEDKTVRVEKTNAENCVLDNDPCTN